MKIIGELFVGVGCLIEHEAVDGRLGRIEHAHGQEILAGHQRLRRVERDWGLAALVAADVAPVDPDIGEIIDSLETEQGALTRRRRAHGDEHGPIPGHAVSSGENLLNRAGHGRVTPGRVRDMVEPALHAAAIVRVERETPTSSQRLDCCRPLRGHGHE